MSLLSARRTPTSSERAAFAFAELGPRATARSHLVSPVHSCRKFSAVLRLTESEWVGGARSDQTDWDVSDESSLRSGSAPSKPLKVVPLDDVREELNLDPPCGCLANLDVEKDDGARDASRCVEGHDRRATRSVEVEVWRATGRGL